MLSSPKSLEVISNFAPEDKKAMYLGFANLPGAIGWMLEAYLAPMLYDRYSAKETLSREMMREQGVTSAQLAEIPTGEAFTYLVELTGQTPQAITAILYETNNVGYVWYIMGLVAVISAVGFMVYAIWMNRLLNPGTTAGPQKAPDVRRN